MWIASLESQQLAAAPWGWRYIGGERGGREPAGRRRPDPSRQLVADGAGAGSEPVAEAQPGRFWFPMARGALPWRGVQVGEWVRPGWGSQRPPLAWMIRASDWGVLPWILRPHSFDLSQIPSYFHRAPSMESQSRKATLWSPAWLLGASLPGLFGPQMHVFRLAALGWGQRPGKVGVVASFLTLKSSQNPLRSRIAVTFVLSLLEEHAWY